MTPGDTPAPGIPHPPSPSAPQASAAPQGESEVLLSGLDTGPSLDERSNLTPTQEHARLAADSRVRSSALGFVPDPDDLDADDLVPDNLDIGDPEAEH